MEDMMGSAKVGKIKPGTARITPDFALFSGKVMDRRIAYAGVFAGLLGLFAWGATAGAKPKQATAKSSPSSRISETANREDSIHWLHNLRVAHHVSVATGRPILIVFGGPWCQYCKKLENEVLTQPRLAQFINTSFVPVHIDTGVDENHWISEALEVHALPTSVVLNSNADLIGFIEGYVEAPKFAQALKEALTYQRTLSVQKASATQGK